MVGRKALSTSRSLLTAFLLAFCRSRYRSHLDCCFGRFFHYIMLMGFFISLMCSIFLHFSFTVIPDLHNLICLTDRSCISYFLSIHFCKMGLFVCCCKVHLLSTDKWRFAAIGLHTVLWGNCFSHPASSHFLNKHFLTTLCCSALLW